MNEVIKHAQTTLREENYKATVIMLQNIKDDLKRVESEWGNVKDTVKIDIHDTIKEIGVDISSLSSFSMIKSDNNQSETLKPLDIHSHLESARDIIVFIETEIRKKKI